MSYPPVARFIFLRRLKEWPKKDPGSPIWIANGPTDTMEIIVEAQDERGEVVASDLQGRRFRGTYGVVLDNEEGITREIWWWREIR